MLGIDQAQGQQAPGQRQRQQSARRGPEMPGHHQRQQCTGRLHQRIARADAPFAGGAAPAQGKVAQQRNVLPRADAVVAMRAARGGQAQVEALVHRARQPQHLLGFALPLAVEHDRQAVHQHVEKTADQQPQHGGHRDEVNRLFSQESP
ncbi:hypothetical protein D3C81_1827490 [compost metagenome]